MSKLQAYQELNTQGRVRLHANESPYHNFPLILESTQSKLNALRINDYPSLNADKLKDKLASYYGVKASELLFGNGSDELITMVMQCYLQANDVVVTHAPTFSQYAWNAALLRAQLIEVQDKANYEIDIDGLIEATLVSKAKLLILCTPNNPTGALISETDMNKIMASTSCMIMVDEAYVDFVDQDYKERVLKSERMISLRTFSKAFGCAGLRFGVAIAQESIISFLNQSRQPYNINALTQLFIEAVLDHVPLIQNQVQRMLVNKTSLQAALKELGCVLAPSQANFIFFAHPEVEKIQHQLDQQGFAIKGFYPINQPYPHARMSIPHEDDMEALISALKGFQR
jgi:histidinol-phosphate aminotransferase